MECRWIDDTRAIATIGRWDPIRLFVDALAELCRECRSVEALAPVGNAAGDREHRADMKIKQPTDPQ